MKLFALLTLLFTFSASAQFRDIGTITTTNAIGWEVVTNANAYRIYIGATNQPVPFPLAATVTTNRWPGTNSMTLNGWKALYVTAVNTNIVEESDPSEVVLVRFRAGVPIPPKNIQIFSVVQAAAANALQVRPEPPPLPSTATERSDR